MVSGSEFEVKLVYNMYFDEMGSSFIKLFVV